MPAQNSKSHTNWFLQVTSITARTSHTILEIWLFAPIFTSQLIEGKKEKSNAIRGHPQSMSRYF